MKRIYKSLFVVAAAVALLPSAASGQNLDPTVEVSRQYEGKLMEVHKPLLKMAVPDSVLRFDLEFDYSVTDKPYKGAYEFSPYVVEMKPSPVVYERKSFYLKAGAGYSLHPELDLVWSPKFRKNAFRMDVYASHRSYFGKYWNLNKAAIDDGTFVIDRIDAGGNAERAQKGFDIVNRAGVSGRLDWEKGLFRFDVGYHGLMQDDSQAVMVNRFYDALVTRLGVATKRQTGFLYNVGLGYTLSGDNVSVLHYTQDCVDGMDLKASEVDFDVALGYARESGKKFLLDLGASSAFMSGAWAYHGTDLDIVPHYVLGTGKWKFDLGVRFSAAVVTSRFSDKYGPVGQFVYPDVRIEYQAVRDALKLYLDVGGDAEVNSYSDLLAFNRHLNPAYCLNDYEWEFMDASKEKVNAVLGFEAKIGPRFSFDLRGGYVAYADALMDGLYLTGFSGVHDSSARLRPCVGYGSYNKAFAAIDWLLDAESVRFGGNVEYAYSYSTQKPRNLEGLFMPAALKGNVELTYNWNRRIFAGIDCGFSTARNGSAVYLSAEASDEYGSVSAKIPGYADLGVNLEYAVNRKFSVWARGGNLLGMTIQRSILYAEKGPYFTAGICLNL